MRRRQFRHFIDLTDALWTNVAFDTLVHVNHEELSAIIRAQDSSPFFHPSAAFSRPPRGTKAKSWKRVPGRKVAYVPMLRLL